MNKPVARFALSLLALLPSAVIAGSTIYRCHALNGALLFQDKPCNQVPGTREAQAGQEGEVMPAAAPPAEDGSAVNGRYTRLLDEADRQKRAQAEADAAEARRLQAERAAAPPATSDSAGCRGYGANGDCLDAFYPAYGAYPLPPQRQRPPPPAPAPAPAPAPSPAGRRPPVSAADAAAKATRDLMAIP